MNIAIIKKFKPFSLEVDFKNPEKAQAFCEKMFDVYNKTQSENVKILAELVEKELIVQDYLSKRKKE